MDEIFLSHIAMSNINNACYITDVVTYELLFVNEVAKKLHGIEEKDYLGCQCFEVIHGKNKICEFCTNKHLAKGKVYKWVHFNSLLQKYFEMTDKMIELDGRLIKIQIGVDITELKNKILQLEIKSNQEETLIKRVQTISEHVLKNKSSALDFKKAVSVDVFSGLYNRNKYIQTIEEIETDNINRSIGIVYIDINGLKQVNNQYGYVYGDRLILKVVDIMKACFEDNLFRTGDDEFVVLLMNSDRCIFEEKVSRFRNITNIQTDVSVSIGSTWCNDSINISKEIIHADELMFVDKQYHYANRQNNHKSYKATIATELQDSIAANNFIILLQPQVCLSEEKVIGAEALVRKKDGQGGLISPDKFIAIYESDGVIPLLDFHVLETVCKMLHQWRKDQKPLVRISVNFSRLTILEYNVAKKINNICKKYGIESKYITIELTEHISNISLKNLNEILEEIKSFGFQIALDDFGREYANLSILSRIAFNEIKLDKSLIDNLADCPATSISLRCIIEMCNAHRPTTIVIEGIETYEQVKKLRNSDYKLPLVQGYYFSKPLSVEAFLQYYHNHR